MLEENKLVLVQVWLPHKCSIDPTQNILFVCTTLSLARSGETLLARSGETLLVLCKVHHHASMVLVLALPGHAPCCDLVAFHFELWFRACLLVDVAARLTNPATRLPTETAFASKTISSSSVAASV